MQISVSVQRQPGETEQKSISLPDDATKDQVSRAFESAGAFLTDQMDKATR